MSGLDSAQLRTLAAVVSEGSFEAAGRLLHVTPSAVSQRIKALEETVGQVLVRRQRPCDATEAGRPLLRLAGQLALLEREALADARGPLGGDPGRTRVAVVVNADSLATWFPAALARLPAPPELSFDIRQDDQDHSAELLRAGAVMAAVTAQREAVQGCRVRPSARCGTGRWPPRRPCDGGSPTVSPVRRSPPRRWCSSTAGTASSTASCVR